MNTQGMVHEITRGLMHMLGDTWIVLGRQMTLSLRNPVWVVAGLTQPVLYLALFGPLLGPLVDVAGFPAGDAWQVFVPGLLVMQAIFGAAFVGFNIIADWRSGVLERLRVTPTSRLALLLGRIVHDVLVLVVQSVVLVLVALAFGLRAPFLGILIGLGFMVLIGITISALSYAVALRLKNENSLAPVVNSVGMPVLLLSGILLPISLAPGWLNALAYANPFRYTVDAMRDAVLGRYATSSMLVGVVVTLVVAALATTLGIRAFSQENP